MPILACAQSCGPQPLERTIRCGLIDVNNFSSALPSFLDIAAEFDHLPRQGKWPTPSGQPDGSSRTR